MADRVLRGSRLGAVSYETDRNHDLAPRQSMRYTCPRGHDFDVPFANDAEAPSTWECRLHGSISRLVDGAAPEQKRHPSKGLLLVESPRDTPNVDRDLSRSDVSIRRSCYPRTHRHPHVEFLPQRLPHPRARNA